MFWIVTENVKGFQVSRKETEEVRKSLLEHADVIATTLNSSGSNSLEALSEVIGVTRGGQGAAAVGRAAAGRGARKL